MKKHTKLAFIGTIAMTLAQLFNIVFSRIFSSSGELFYFLIPIIDLFGMLTLVNFFYQLYQKQNQKINSVATKSENPFENQ